MDVKLSFLIEKLNQTCRAALERASSSCVRQRNYEVELEHVLIEMFGDADSDATRIAQHYRMDSAKVSWALTKEIDAMRTGCQRAPVFSTELESLLVDSWTLGSIEYRADAIRSGIFLITVMSTPNVARRLCNLCDEFQQIRTNDLRRNLVSLLSKLENGLTSESIRNDLQTDDVDSSEPGKAIGNTPHLDKYTFDMTGAASQGKIDPVLGREREIGQIVDILMRRRQNNPILTGEPGVGKTAIVEGFASKVVAGDVPPLLRDVQVRLLDLGLLQAGAGVKGEFENRLKGVITEVKASLHPIVLFIDEAHTIIGAGGAAGQSDAANLLKPALARGELRTIAATTWSEYKKYFEKDAALARRFQEVVVDEPDERTATVMVRGLVETLEKHHAVTILDEAVGASVRLSSRYLSGRQMPDKCVSVLDTACARVAVSQAALPRVLDGCEQGIKQLGTEIKALQRESARGTDHSTTLEGLIAEEQNLARRKGELEQQFSAEKDLVGQILAMHRRFEQSSASLENHAPDTPASDSNPDDMRTELQRLTKELAVLQGECPLVKPFVDAQSVAEIISNWTGIPLGRMVQDEFQMLLNLEKTLEQRVIGQPHALREICGRIRTARAGMDDPKQPAGVFMLVGPSGVGKTETARALADVLYGGERSLITINMSEYKEPHSVSGLKGSPPGYVGYGQGGLLTEAARKRPYSLLLVDEFEKAHVDVQELFYQVFADGVLEDSEGRRIDFKHTLIVLTSNAAADVVLRLCSGAGGMPSQEALNEQIKQALRRYFKDALLGRCTIVPYYPLETASLERIVEIKLGQIRARLEQTHGIAFDYSRKLAAQIAQRCNEVESGARNVEHILAGSVLAPLSQGLLVELAGGSRPSRVRVSLGVGGVVCRFS